MKKILAIIIFSFLLAGCVAHVTPEGTYLEPLPATIIVGPPVIVPPPPHLVVRPLPPVFLLPERHIYFYEGIYYNYWDGGWYYSDRQKGPWHKLPREYHPRHYKKYDRHDKDYRRHRDRHDD
ncbi:MAG: hypothetical protein AB1632_01500 [Nitrospirota bacterium]